MNDVVRAIIDTGYFYGPPGMDVPGAVADGCVTEYRISDPAAAQEALSALFADPDGVPPEIFILLAAQDYAPTAARVVVDLLRVLTYAPGSGAALDRLDALGMAQEALGLRTAVDRARDRATRLLDLVPPLEREEPRFARWVADRLAERDRVLAGRAREAALAKRK